jgi:hypothetical protein
MKELILFLMTPIKLFIVCIESATEVKKRCCAEKKSTMNRSQYFLSEFDALHIGRYYGNDFKLIKEIFEIADNYFEIDLVNIRHAFCKKQIDLLQNAIHTIKPTFHTLGLLALEKEINKFYGLCTELECFEKLENTFLQLWPKLVNTHLLIGEQVKLLKSRALSD